MMFSKCVYENCFVVYYKNKILQMSHLTCLHFLDSFSAEP